MFIEFNYCIVLLSQQLFSLLDLEFRVFVLPRDPNPQILKSSNLILDLCVLILKMKFDLFLFRCCFIVIACLWSDFSSASIIGLKCSNGVILATDNLMIGNERRSLVNRFGNSLYAVTPNLILGCVRNEYQFRKILSEITVMVSLMKKKFDTALSPTAIANFARYLVKTKFPDCSLLIAGENDEERKSAYQLFLVTEGGTLVEQDVFTFGDIGSFTHAFLRDSQELGSQLLPGIPHSFDPFQSHEEPALNPLPSVDQAIQLIHKGMKVSGKAFSKLITKPKFMVVSNEYVQ